MDINADFTKPAFVHTDTLDWQASPMAGVDRRMLDRIGDEVARATSIVRYAERSSFSEHTHSGGEEFIVLEGVFQDEHADYPAGTYVRNPIGTHHVSRSDPGCSIFVKLWQFDQDDRQQMAVDLDELVLEADPMRPGVHHAIIANPGYEQVALEEWAAQTSAEIGDDGGSEVLILRGSLIHEGVVHKLHDWIRLPPDAVGQFAAGPQGARIWIKRGHLKTIRVPD